MEEGDILIDQDDIVELRKMQEAIFRPKNTKAINIKPDEVGWEEKFMIKDKKKPKTKKAKPGDKVINESIQEMGYGPKLDSTLDEYKKPDDYFKLK